MIECFSNVRGHKEAQQVLGELNELKSRDSIFFLDSNRENCYTITGHVTREDWDRLDLESDFMEI